jgi:hypothetical protein
VRLVRGLARAHARVVHAVLWHGSPCPRRDRLPPRRARLPLATHLPSPVYSMRSDHVIYINENGNSIQKLIT